MRNVPKLRFKEFSGDWEEKRLEEITTYVDYRGKTPEKTENGIFLVTAKNIKMGYIDYTTSQEFVSSENYDEIMKRGKPKIGDVLLTTEAPLGNVAQIDKEDIALAQRVIKFRGQKNLINNTFLKYIFLSENFQNKLKNKAIGTTVLGIQGKVLHKLTLNFSSFLIEQQKIVDFLSSVDKKISITEEKLDLFKEYKKGIMQKIFNQELRFKDSNGNDYPEWEEKRLGDIGKIISGGTPSSVVEEYWNGNIQWFTPTEVGKSKYISKSIRTITELGLSKSSAKLLPKGAILLSSRATIGEKSIALKEVCTNQGFQSILVNQNNSNEFVYYLLDILKQELIKQSSGSTFLEINGKKLGNISAYFPCLEEQQKIADFLSSIDNKIDNLATELEDLKEFKKGLLQQMFV